MQETAPKLAPVCTNNPVKPYFLRAAASSSKLFCTHLSEFIQSEKVQSRISYECDYRPHAFALTPRCTRNWQFLLGRYSTLQNIPPAVAAFRPRGWASELTPGPPALQLKTVTLSSRADVPSG